MDFNKVILIGRLTRDPELRYVQNTERGICRFGLAINRRYKRQDGQQNEETCFVEVVAWGRQAEICNEYLKKGSGALVEGRLSYSTWEAQDGSKRSKLEVTAEQVRFMPRGSGARQESSPAADAAETESTYEGQSGSGADPEVPF